MGNDSSQRDDDLELLRPSPGADDGVPSRHLNRHSFGCLFVDFQMKTRTAYTAVGVLVLIAWIVVELSAGTVAELHSGMALLVFVISLVVFGVCTLLYLVRLQRPPVAGLLCGLLGTGLCLFGVLPGGDGVVDYVKGRDGTEMMIAQRHDGEPYSVGFYVRKSGGNWGWFYYEHEDTRWLRSLRHIRLSDDNRTATIYRLFWPVATFDLEQECFTLLRWGRTTKVQKLTPGDWSPEMVQVRDPSGKVPEKES